MIKRSFRFVLNLFRLLAFHLLLNFNWAIKLFLRFFTILFFLAGIVNLCIINSPVPFYAKITCLLAGLGFSMLNYYFDMLVFKLKPKDNLRIMLVS